MSVSVFAVLSGGGVLPNSKLSVYYLFCVLLSLCVADVLFAVLSGGGVLPTSLLSVVFCFTDSVCTKCL